MTVVLFLVIVGLVLVIILWWFFNKRSKIRNQVDVERLQRILSLCRDITSSIPMNVPLIQQGIDQLFGKGRLTLDIGKVPSGSGIFRSTGELREYGRRSIWALLGFRGEGEAGRPPKA